jgi:hypothetical protein
MLAAVFSPQGHRDTEKTKGFEISDFEFGIGFLRVSVVNYRYRVIQD